MFGRRRRERSPGGSRILRHQARERPFTAAGAGCSETIDAVDRHVERFIGPVDTVQHEIVSDLVHIDVHVVPPGPDRPWTALVTSGMSDRPMRLPRELRGEVPAYAELMVLLPPDWPLDIASWEDERHYWPVRMLKVLARLPHEYDTWLGMWHSVPNGDPPAPFAEDTAFCAVLLAPPVTLPDEFRTLHTEDGRQVGLLAMVPLLADELDLKLREGTDALIDHLDRAGVTELLDPGRRSCVPHA